MADEVGLGKTLVARGVIAQAIDHLWDTVDRIDVVYICSNAQIARQNLAKLRVGGDDRAPPRRPPDHAGHRARRHLEGRKLNFVSFTPGTSFNFAQQRGQSRGAGAALPDGEAWPSPRFVPGPGRTSSAAPPITTASRGECRTTTTRSSPPTLAQDFAQLLRDRDATGRSLLEDVAALRGRVPTLRAG